jgi:DNA-binding transcriptional regulator YdaS (Cro superfamily)
LRYKREQNEFSSLMELVSQWKRWIVVAEISEQCIACQRVTQGECCCERISPLEGYSGRSHCKGNI